QAPQDPVENLREALETDRFDSAAREHQLKQRVQALRTLGDLRRALQLQEWRDQGPDAKLAEADLSIRADLATRFINRVRDALQKGDATTCQAVATMLGEIGMHMRGVRTPTGLTHVFDRDLAALLKHGTPAVREAAARALGRINPNLDVALPAL